MVKIILFTDDSKEQLKLFQTALDVLKKYVESQGEEGKEEINKCHRCGW